ncbi:hypothetical protein Sjap_015596 [Stephania japonica]|uniref:Uncharacterized protein n=1 Tax=Stephania japonica TaxID=461633 RepID=A0AAP0NSN4_9MAGN
MLPKHLNSCTPSPLSLVNPNFKEKKLQNYPHLLRFFRSALVIADDATKSSEDEEQK